MFFPTFVGNKFVQLNEKKARSTFEKQYDVVIIQVGFIINTNFPWFSFSPDGFFKCGLNTYLIEIKCPLEGKKLYGPDLIARLKYLEVINGQLSLKKKHTYFG